MELKDISFEQKNRNIQPLRNKINYDEQFASEKYNSLSREQWYLLLYTDSLTDAIMTNIFRVQEKSEPQRLFFDS